MQLLNAKSFAIKRMEQQKSFTFYVTEFSYQGIMKINAQICNAIAIFYFYIFFFTYECLCTLFTFITTSNILKYKL